jgi:recA bacterial DNA recombination protein
MSHLGSGSSGARSPSLPGHTGRSGRALSTGSFAVDHATDVGGLLRGRVVEIVGITKGSVDPLLLSTLASTADIGRTA